MTVESVVGSVIPAPSAGGKLLVLSNGAYGERLAKMASMYGIDHDVVRFGETEAVDVSVVEATLAKTQYTHVAVIHHETTAGTLNDIKGECECECECEVGSSVHPSIRPFV